MQKFIAKYGLAAHLAILAVAPLFLFPFVEESVTVGVLLWLSLVAAAWVLIAPSVLAFEHLSDARRRVLGQIGRDPLLWVLISVSLAALFRAANGGIALTYDAELSLWRVSDAFFSVLPGSVGSSGWLPLATVLAVSVLILGCRHSLGRSARMAFLVMASSLAGLAACVSHLAVRCGGAHADLLVDFAKAEYSFAGFGFGLYLLAGTVALLSALENGWNLALVLPILAIGGCGAGLFSFAPAYLMLSFAVAEVILLVYVFSYGKGRFRSADELKLVSLELISLVFAWLLSAALLPDRVLSARLAVFPNWVLFPDDFWTVRATLSDMAFRSWIGHLWMGTGVASFPLDFRFCATPSDWAAMPMGASSLPNGWWRLLAERGVVGVGFFLLPVCFLLVAYGRRLSDSIPNWRMPHPACLLMPLSLILFGGSSFLDCSTMRAEVLMALGALSMVSAVSFPKRK